jgi:hypothetical protein
MEKPAGFGLPLVDCPHNRSGLLQFDLGSSTTKGGKLNIVIPVGPAVLISGGSALGSADDPLGVITVPRGAELIFDDSGPIAIHANSVVIDGIVRIGGNACPIESKITITLHGQRPSTGLDDQPWEAKGVVVHGLLEVSDAEWAQQCSPQSCSEQNCALI